jgi:hypothetical protein
MVMGSYWVQSQDLTLDALKKFHRDVARRETKLLLFSHLQPRLVRVRGQRFSLLSYDDDEIVNWFIPLGDSVGMDYISASSERWWSIIIIVTTTAAASSTRLANALVFGRTIVKFELRQII